MKKIKCIIAFALSLSLCTAMAGCGEDKAESSSSSVADTTKADSVNDESSEDSEEETEAEETEAAEETSEEESDEFAYYNDLAEEYKNNSLSEIISSDQSKTSFSIVKSSDGKSHILDYGYDIFGNRFYDMETKKLVDGNFSVCDGRNLYYYNKNDKAFIKYDLDGNEIQKIDFEYAIGCGEEFELQFSGFDGDYIVSPNQEIIGWDYDNKTLSVLSADFKTFTALPSPTVTEGSHGLATELNGIQVLGFSNDKLVVHGHITEGSDVQYYICSMDMTSKEWTITATDCRLGGMAVSLHTKIFGKYLLSYYGLVNIETGEIISEGDFSNYAGGTFSVEYSGDGEKIGHYTEDGEFVSIGDNIVDSGKVYPISDTQFIYKDDYGAFIRNFDDPETDVETVYLNQQ